MAVDMNIWRNLVIDEVNNLADEEWLRNLWLGNIPGYVGSADEQFNRYFSNAAIEEFLGRSDTGFNDKQLQSLRHLTKMMGDLCNETKDQKFLPPSFIDDPRWQKVIAAAKETKRLLDL